MQPVANLPTKRLPPPGLAHPGQDVCAWGTWPSLVLGTERGFSLGWPVAPSQATLCAQRGYLTYALVPRNSLLHGPRDSHRLGLHPKAAGPGRGEASYMEGHFTGSIAGLHRGRTEQGGRAEAQEKSQVRSSNSLRSGAQDQGLTGQGNGMPHRAWLLAPISGLQAGWQ